MRQSQGLELSAKKEEDLTPLQFDGLMKDQVPPQRDWTRLANRTDDGESRCERTVSFVLRLRAESVFSCMCSKVFPGGVSTAVWDWFPLDRSGFDNGAGTTCLSRCQEIRCKYLALKPDAALSTSLAVQRAGAVIGLASPRSARTPLAKS